MFCKGSEKAVYIARMLRRNIHTYYSNNASSDCDRGHTHRTCAQRGKRLHACKGKTKLDECSADTPLCMGPKSAKIPFSKISN